MRKGSLLIGAGLLTLASAGRGTEAAWIHLLNGDRFRGEFHGMEGPFLRITPSWASKEAGERIRIHGRMLDEVFFPKSPERTAFPMEVKLAGGGRIRGDVLGMDEERLRVRTRWSREVEIDRRLAQWIRRVEVAEGTRQSLLRADADWAFYDGDFRLLRDVPDAVNRDPRGWEFLREGVYILSTRPLPAHAAGLRWEWGVPEENAQGAITLEVNGFPGPDLTMRQVKFRVIQGRILAEIFEGSRLVRRWELPRSRWMVLRVSDERNRLEIEMDQGRTRGVDIGGWEFHPDPHPLEIRLAVSRGVGGVRLRKMEAYGLREEYPLEIPTGDRESDAIVFSNGDRMRARVDAVDAEGGVELTLEAGGTLRVPLSRIGFLPLNPPKGIRIRRRAAHVEVTLAGGTDRFTAELLGATSDSLRVRREGWDGIQELPLNQVDRIQFNPYSLEQ